MAFFLTGKVPKTETAALILGDGTKYKWDLRKSKNYKEALETYTGDLRKICKNAMDSLCLTTSGCRRRPPYSSPGTTPLGKKRAKHASVVPRGASVVGG